MDLTIFKNNAGQFRTDDLFWETSDKERRILRPPLYTLKEHEHMGLPSAYQIYINSVDEYDAANKLVGSQRHWRKLCKLKWFVQGNEQLCFEGIQSWRDEMVQRDISRAKDGLWKAAADGDLGAMKKLLDVAMGATKAPVGRPAKQTKSKEPGRLAKIEALHKNING